MVKLKLRLFDRKQDLTLSNFQLVHKWSKDFWGIIIEEAHHLHKSFGHPTVKKYPLWEEVLHPFGTVHPEEEPALRQMLTHVAKNCKPCQMNAKTLGVCTVI